VARWTEVVPIVWSIDGVSVVRLMGGIDDGRPVASDDGGEGLVELCRT
jgi:hypothetical protein